MSRKRKRKSKHDKEGPITVELNLMPFIDVFSLMTTFLLFSAVFIQIGILEVQVPFLSNAAPPADDKPSRIISVKTDLTKDSIEILTEWSEAPKDPQSYKFNHNDAGIQEMHKKLVEIRMANPDTDKLTFFVDDEIKYEEMTKVLDSIKLLDEADPDMRLPAGKDDDGEEETTHQTRYLYKKVIMGSVLL
ncbi:MAG: biopolymer transporter ExbD [Bdellovibrionota bacterium]